MNQKSHLLLIDDDSDDRQLFATALEKSGLDVDLSEVTDGSAALDYLLGKKPYNDQAKYPYPDLIILDLKMPGMDGFELLKEIRKSIGAQNLPMSFSPTHIP